MAIGAALHSVGEHPESIDDVISKIEKITESAAVHSGKPLFESKEEYAAFVKRHRATDLKFADISSYSGDCYLGIDSGSTTTKLMLITPDCRILWSHYQSNNGQPLDIVVKKLKEVYELGGSRIKFAAVRLRATART